jgi:hypothetical protein
MPLSSEDLQRLLAKEGQTKRAPESQAKRRALRAFIRYLVAICIGIAGTLAWQSYGEATKQIIATRAPELGWSPEVKQMIASLVQQLGWTKPPAGSEKQAAPVAQTAPENVAPKVPATVSLDPDQLQQITGSLTTLRQTVEQLAVRQDQVLREIAKLQAAAAPTGKPSQAPTTAPHP